MDAVTEEEKKERKRNLRLLQKARYRAKNKERLRLKQREYYARTREERCRKQREYVEKNKDAVSEKKKEYYKKNCERIKEKSRRHWHSQDPKERKKKRKAYYTENRERLIDQSKAFYRKNKNYRMRYLAEYHKKRIQKGDRLYELSCLIRSRVCSAFRQKKWGKNTKTQETLGCDWETLKDHIEGQFTDGMTWENRGYRGWHIDHVVPLSSAESEEELVALCHYTNLQPLWWRDNITKGSKLPQKAAGSSQEA